MVKYMDKHKKAVIIQDILDTLYYVRQNSWSSKIDDRCDRGITNLFKLAGVEGVQKQLDEIRERRIDPTN